ncbi:MAG: Asp-tRNA(Asn)/Glu-tRNA(Gln) amidotransferase subunit GatB [Candidatus Woesearchaeota archaeon]
MSERTLKVGLEIHVYPRMESKAKLFCDCTIDPEAKPNTNICPVCTAQPGANPMAPNEEAIIKTIAIARLFGSTLDPKPAFQRKHYSYPDLPAGYQRTMSGSYAYPIARKGSFESVRIMQVHLEEDPARYDPQTGSVDYNRSGTPLIEIVTEPDITSAEHAREWLEKLRRRLDYAGCFDERFGIKADVNVSIAPKYERVEIKNINSFSAILEAIESEAQRQRELVSRSEPVPHETRTWTGTETVFMRSKEHALDYRFIPEQDLPRIAINDTMRDEAAALTERDPEAVLQSLIAAGMNAEDAAIITVHPVVSEHAERILAKGIEGGFAGRFLRSEFLRVVNYHQAHPRSFAGSSEHLAEAARLASDGAISDKTMRELVEQLYEEDFSPQERVENEGLGMVSDDAALRDAARTVIDANPKAADDYRAGNEKTMNFLAGQLMRSMQGKADIKKARAILEQMIPRS